MDYLNDTLAVSDFRYINVIRGLTSEIDIYTEISSNRRYYKHFFNIP